MVQPTRRTGKCLALWGKGGAGKTTSALAVASLAAAEGLRTIILDADPPVFRQCLVFMQQQSWPYRSQH